MSTFGEIVDKIATINQKLFTVQDDLYEIRRMTFEEFKKAYSSEEQMQKLYDVFKKACDLNVNRNYLIYDLDKKLLEIIDAKMANKTQEGQFAQDPIKLY